MDRTYTTDTIGRRKRVCPTCGKHKYPGKAFPNENFECFTCNRTRVGIAVCKSCGKEKPLEDFPSRGRRPNGELNLWRCRNCTRAYQDEWVKRNPERVRGYQRKCQIGVEREAYEAAIEASGGLCPICHRLFQDTPHADHDHMTGVFRGVLCRACNNGLGQFADSVDSLQRAIEYLQVAR